MSALILSASADDILLTDALYGYPSQGIHIGGGIHVTVPASFRALVASGSSVPGVTATKGFNSSGSLVIDTAQVALLQSASVQVQLQVTVGANATRVSQYVSRVNAAVISGSAPP